MSPRGRRFAMGGRGAADSSGSGWPACVRGSPVSAEDAGRGRARAAEAGSGGQGGRVIIVFSPRAGRSHDRTCSHLKPDGPRRVPGRVSTIATRAPAAFRSPSTLPPARRPDGNKLSLIRSFRAQTNAEATAEGRHYLLTRLPTRRRFSTRAAANNPEGRRTGSIHGRKSWAGGRSPPYGFACPDCTRKRWGATWARSAAPVRIRGRTPTRRASRSPTVVPPARDRRRTGSGRQRGPVGASRTAKPGRRRRVAAKRPRAGGQASSAGEKGVRT